MDKPTNRVLQVVTVMKRGGLEIMLMNHYRAVDCTKVQFDFLVHRPEEGGYEKEILELGSRTDLNEMTKVLKEELAKFNAEIGNVEIICGSEQNGDNPHSSADISKARNLLGYDPSHSFSDGIKEAAEWYFSNLSILSSGSFALPCSSSNADKN